MKLCVGDGQGQACELIEGLPYFRTYYQVGLDKEGQVTIKCKEKGEAFADIKIIRAQKK